MAQTNVSPFAAEDRLNNGRVPSRISAAVFGLKRTAHQIRRAIKDCWQDVKKCPKKPSSLFPVVVAESRSALRAGSPLAETAFQEGKVQNLRRAAAEIDGAFLEAGATFSFWKEVGRTSQRRGYAVGRMLQEGCLIPAVGGGLCQLSNALYDAALQSGCEIVERHSHSRVVPGSLAAEGRDATVAWNYVDLRFLANHPLAIRVRFEGDDLVVRFYRPEGSKPLLAPHAESSETHPATSGASLAAARTCGTCAETACFRHESTDRDLRGGKSEKASGSF